VQTSYPLLKNTATPPATSRLAQDKADLGL